MTEKKKHLNPQLRIKIRMAAAACNPKLAIGGGDKKIKPRPITLPTLSKKDGAKA